MAFRFLLSPGSCNWHSNANITRVFFVSRKNLFPLLEFLDKEINYASVPNLKYLHVSSSLVLCSCFTISEDLPFQAFACASTLSVSSQENYLHAWCVITQGRISKRWLQVLMTFFSLSLHSVANFCLMSALMCFFLCCLNVFQAALLCFKM